MSAGGDVLSNRAGWVDLARAAGRSEAREETELPRELLTLAVGEDVYAVPVERIREIVRLKPITLLPRVPREVLGVVPLRGEIVQVVDLRIRLGLDSRGPHARSRIVVLHGEDAKIAGLLVDRVIEVLRVPESELGDPPPGESDLVVALLVRGEDFVSILDADRVLDLGIER